MSGKRETKKMNTATKVLIALGIYLGIFIQEMIFLFWRQGATPETLIQCVLGGGVVEVFVLAFIKVAKVRNRNKSDSPPSENGREI